jgi:Do/DeqQ family serine protease
MKHGILSALLVIGFVVPGFSQGKNPLGQARELNDAFAGVYEKVAPAVVVIEVVGGEETVGRQLPQGLDFFFRSPDGNRMEPESEQGSGFIISTDGLILTNNHVVQNGETGRISVSMQDGRKFPAKLVGRDEKSDIAVLKIDAKDLPTVELGDSDQAKVGQFAFAIGAPFDLPYTFTVGVVSAKGRTNLTGSKNYEEFIQTDASINPGNSGGPLCDLDGRVIGINTLISGINRGLGFAVPINIAKNISSQLIDKGRVSRAWLGIGIVGLEENPSIKALFPGLEAGVVVESIEPGTPAYRSRLQAGDVILRVDGRKVALSRDLQREILSKSIGQSVNLEVWRRGRVVSVDVQTGEQPDRLMRASRSMQPVFPGDEQVVPAPVPRPRPGDMPPGGMAVKELSDHRGVQVTEVVPGSPAELAGLQPGDIISEMAGKPVHSLKDFNVLLNETDPDRGAMMLIERDGQKTFAILKP